MSSKERDLPVVQASRARAVLKQLASMQPMQRLDALLERGDLPQLLPALPIQDVYTLIRQVGVADALELLEQAPPPVLQGMLDFAAWSRDRVDPRHLAQFYAALFHADAEGAAEKVLQMDLEMCTLFLKLHARVHRITEDGVPDTESQDTWTTPDRKFLVEFTDAPGLPSEDQDPLGLGEKGRELARRAAREMLEGIATKDAALVSRLLDSIQYELPSQLEEDALRWREGRLADLGFPPREEALRVLGYLDPDTPRLRTVMSPAAPTEDDGVGDQALALYTLPDVLAREPFLAAALKPLEGEDALARQRELAVLCNRVAVARDAPIGDVDAMRGVVLEVRTLVNLGLAYRSRGDESAAAGVLGGVALEDIYRVGNSLVMKLQRQARRVMQPAWGTPQSLVRVLDAPLGLALAALLGRTPLFMTGLQKPGAVDTRAFATLEDLAVAARALADGAFRLALGFDVLGFRPEQLTRDALASTNLADRAEVTLEVLLTTALFRVLAGGALDPSPLRASELEAARRVLADPSSVSRAAMALEAVAAPRVPLPGCRTPADVSERCRGLAGVLLARALDEVSGVPAGDALDARFISRVLVGS